MRNGIYSLKLSASEFSASGSSTVEDGRIRSEDRAFRIAGTVTRKATHAVGHFHVELVPGAVRNSVLPTTFPIETTGSASETEFSLVGAGPLGLIVELSGRWIG